MMMNDEDWMMMSDDECWWMMMNEWWWLIWRWMVMIDMMMSDDEWWWMLMNDDEWTMMNDDEWWWPIWWLIWWLLWWWKMMNHDEWWRNDDEWWRTMMMIIIAIVFFLLHRGMLKKPSVSKPSWPAEAAPSCSAGGPRLWASDLRRGPSLASLGFRYQNSSFAFISVETSSNLLCENYLIMLEFFKYQF